MKFLLITLVTMLTAGGAYAQDFGALAVDAAVLRGQAMEASFPSPEPGAGTPAANADRCGGLQDQANYTNHTFASGVFMFAGDAETALRNAEAALKRAGYLVRSARRNDNRYLITFAAPGCVNIAKFRSEGFYPLAAKAREAMIAKALELEMGGNVILEARLNGAKFAISYICANGNEAAAAKRSADRSSLVKSYGIYGDVKEEVCPGGREVNDSFVCSSVENAFKVYATPIRRENSIPALPAEWANWAMGPVDLGLIPDDSTGYMFFYNYKLLDDAGNLVGYAQMIGTHNDQSNSRNKTTTKYNLKGELAAIKLEDF